MKYPFIPHLSDKELNVIYKDLKELLEYNKNEIRNQLNSYLHKLTLTKRDNSRVLTDDETELYEYLHRFDWDVDIDAVYKDYFNYMDNYKSLEEEYKLLQEEYKTAKQIDQELYYYSNFSNYCTNKPLSEIKKIETKLASIETKLKELHIPKIVIVIFRRAFIYDLTDTFIEIKKERKIRRESKKKR